jgi:Carboxypeptidase regulatory-like domain
MTALFLLMAFLAQSQDCSISGRVYSASTGAPLKKADVRLAGQGVNARLTESASTTDAEGAFHFNRLAAGQYIVMADRNAYLHASVNASCGATDVVIKLQPQAMIYGRVIDDDGEPFGHANVSIYSRRWVRGQRQLQVVEGTSAQGDGSFVLGNLMPGNYYLSARGNTRPLNGEAFVENFFPNSPDAQSASPVSVGPGADVRGIELRVRSVRVYSIRGKASIQSGDPVNGVPLMLIHTAGPNRGSMSNAGTTGGMFEFHNVAPGTYAIQSLTSRPVDGGGPATLMTNLPITVGEGDIENLQVTLIPGTEIPGTVKLDDAPFTQNMQVALQMMNGIGADYNAQIKQGAFSLRNIASAAYRVQIQNLPAGYYVKAIRFAGRDLVRRELDLSAGGGGALEIILSSKPASVTGTVRNSDGDPVADSTVNLWTKDDPDIRTARTDASGHFTISNLAPGECRVIAWESLDRGVIENPSFRAAFESQAIVVTLKEGSSESADLKVVSKAASDLEVAKLP